MTLGNLRVRVIKATGIELRGASFARVALSLGDAKVTTPAVKIPKRSSQEVVWPQDQGKADVIFRVSSPTESLSVVLYSSRTERQRDRLNTIGRMSIAINHLPTTRVVEKWFQIGSCILQLQLSCDIEYSLTRQSVDTGVTVYPVPDAPVVRVGQLSPAMISQANSTPRFIDYFLDIGLPPTEFRLGGEANKPRILDRYPPEDREDFPLSEQIPMFCFPTGMAIETKRPEPFSFTFKLTDGSTSVYGETLVFYSETTRDIFAAAPSSAAAITTFPSRVYYPRALCILSRFSFTPQFRAILGKLYELYFAPSLFTPAGGEEEADDDGDWDVFELEQAAALAEEETSAARDALMEARAQLARTVSAGDDDMELDVDELMQLADEDDDDEDLSPRRSSSGSRGTGAGDEQPPPEGGHHRRGSSFSRNRQATLSVATDNRGVPRKRRSASPESGSTLSASTAKKPSPSTSAESGPTPDSSGPNRAWSGLGRRKKSHKQGGSANSTPNAPNRKLPACLPGKKRRQRSRKGAEEHSPPVSPKMAAQQRVDTRLARSQSLGVDHSKKYRDTIAKRQARKSAERAIAEAEKAARIAAEKARVIELQRAILRRASRKRRLARLRRGGVLEEEENGDKAPAPAPLESPTHQRTESPMLIVSSSPAQPHGMLVVSTSPPESRVARLSVSTGGDDDDEVPSSPTPATPEAPFESILERSGLDPSGRSLEQYITMVCDEVPLPVRGRTSVGFRIYDLQITTALPPAELEFPHFDLPVEELFNILDLQTVQQIMTCIFTEGQIIFHSSQHSLLFFVQECLLALCFPFEWEHVYIPVLPRELSHIIQAPVPFLVGIHSSILPPDIDELWQSSQVIVVDIDRSELDCSIAPPPFPKMESRNLSRSLMGIIRPRVFVADRITSSLAERASAPRQHVWSLDLDRRKQRAIRAAFLFFIAEILTDYRNFVFYVNGHDPIFQTPEFLAHRRASYKQSSHANQSLTFLSRLLETQMFTSFVEKHVSSPAFLADYVSYIEDPAVWRIRKDTTHFSGGSLTFMVPMPMRFEEVVDTGRLTEAAVQAASDDLYASLEEWLATPCALRDSLFRDDRWPLHRHYDTPDPHAPVLDTPTGGDAQSDDEDSALQLDVLGRGAPPGHQAVTLAEMQMPRRLKIKSLIEQQKEKEDQTMNQLLAVLVVDHYISRAFAAPKVRAFQQVVEEVNVGELAAVAELFKLQHWRTAFVDWFDRNEIGETCCNTPAFRALTLLFNICIQEVQVRRDFGTAKRLADVSTKIFRYITEEDRREMLCQCIQSHKIWSFTHLWSHSLHRVVEDHKQAEPHEPQQQFEGFVFQELSKLIFLMFSVGVKLPATKQFVEKQCARYGLPDESSLILVQLAGNIFRSVGFE